MAGVYVGNSHLPRGVHLWTQMGRLQTTSVAFPTSCFLFLGKRDRGIASMTVFKKVMQMITIVTQFIAYCVADFFLEWLSLYRIKSLVLVPKWLDCFCLFPEMFSSLVSVTFSEVPLDRLIRFGELCFPLHFLCRFWQCEAVEVIRCRANEFPCFHMRFSGTPRFLSPVSYDLQLQFCHSCWIKNKCWCHWIAYITAGGD